MFKLKTKKKKLNFDTVFNLEEIAEILTITSEDSEFVCAFQHKGTSDIEISIAAVSLAKIKDKKVKLVLAEDMAEQLN